MRTNELASAIEEMMDNTPRVRFTLETGNGETYANNNATLYAHSTYGRGSVLAGMSRRVWVEDFDSFEEARAALAEVKKLVRKFRYADSGPTHIPVAAMVAHLPDGPDF